MTEINNAPQPVRDMSVKIKDAAFPAPFKNVLEFNSPAHGTWNIVHMGMLVPEAQQIYVCAYNCMRGVVLTAAEMNKQDRFSFVILEEDDMIAGKLEDITIEGVASCINKLDKRPPMVLLFTVCVHQFLGCDLDYIYRKLGEQFPDIIFARCFMDCLLQKSGPTPDMKLRSAMYDGITALPVKNKLVSLVGSDLKLSEDSDLNQICKKTGASLKEIAALKNFADYQEMGASELIIVTYPNGVMGGKALAERLGRPFMHLPMSFTYSEIRDSLQKFSNALGFTDKAEISMICDKFEADCEILIAKALEIIGSTEITLDYTYHPRPLGLARLLLVHEFNVSTVYLDSILPEEEEDFKFLKEHFPELTICATMKPECRVSERNKPDSLAIGQKAAWFTGTSHFINLVQGGDLWGYDGIKKTINRMIEAYQAEYDTKDLIVRKGWGCESCI